MFLKALKKSIFLAVLLPFLSFPVSNAQYSDTDVNQINIDKIKAASGIDYILLPNGEKVYSDTASYTVHQNGTYVFSVYDRAGNSETVEVEITNIDTTLPTLELTQIEEDGYVQIEVTSSDNESGISHIVLPDGSIVNEDNAKFKILYNGEYTFQVYDIAGNVTEKTIAIMDIRVVELVVQKAEETRTSTDIAIARRAVNIMPETEEKSLFQLRLNEINEIVDIGELERLNSSASLDVYIKNNNMLSMSLNTNSITFDGFNGTEDMEMKKAITITVSSSLAYDINAYLPTEIQNSDKSSTLDKRIFNIKEGSKDEYQTFANTTDKITLKENNAPGNNREHNIDLKLKGGIHHEKDVYKATIKIEVEQK